MKQELSVIKPSIRTLFRSMAGMFLNFFVAAFYLCVISACSLPAYKMLENTGHGYEVVSGDAFQHLLSFSLDAGGEGAVVVFVDGDGVPWRSRHRVSYEPTSDSPLLLGWFIDSDVSSVYLGRPCYYDLDDKRCSVYWYTHGRYSDEIVKSMVGALNKTLPDRPLILLGHSGGGTLVMLMAERMSNVKSVVTIAGNLQVKQWVEYNQYSELKGSLDPSLRPGLNDKIRQIHFYSPNDSVIRPEWVKQFASKQKNAELIELPVRGHNDGWNIFREDIINVLKRTKHEIDHDA